MLSVTLPQRLGHRLTLYRPLRPCRRVSCSAWRNRYQSAVHCVSKKGAEQRTEAERIAGRSTYRTDSFEALVQDACNSVYYAVRNGETRIEVEFPPLPDSLSGYRGSSDTFIDANAQYALVAAKTLADDAGKRVQLLFPDSAECDRARSMFSYVLESTPSVSLGYTEKGFFKALLGSDPAADGATDGIDIFFILNHSASELPSARRYVEEVIKDRPVVLWNLELETLRADLGLLGFPSKDLHYQFLSQFKSVFFLRLRDYSKSISTAPFLINYSGALFREYPGPWQVLLKQDDGQYVCIAEDRVRYTLFDVKEELMASMGLNTEEEGSAMSFLRRGYKRSTWWEEDLENEISKNWRS